MIGEASDGASAVSLAERRKPHVVIMDVRMPGMDGLEATKHLTERVPDSAVLIFTAYSERSLLSRGLESGAKGYILKEAPHQTLVKAIEKIAAGDGYVDPALMPAFLPGKGDDMLTGRERETLQLLADGMSNADVAARLFISQETVKSHVRHILPSSRPIPGARGGDCASRSDHRLDPRCSWSSSAAAALVALFGSATGRRSLPSEGFESPSWPRLPWRFTSSGTQSRGRALPPRRRADRSGAGREAAPRAVPPRRAVQAMSGIA